jgi:peptidoglycan hydrolase-like protein with peptidoglycan-binding domain
MIDDPSGFYGDKTIEAVKRYQRNKGLPETGMVYEFTRSMIAKDSCN